MSYCSWTNPKNPANFLSYVAEHDVDKKYIAVDEDTIISIVNPRLVESKGISDEGLETIVQGHVTRYKICKQAESLDIAATDFKVKLKQLFDEYTINEFLLQRTWGFPESADFHAWFDFPHCMCPKLDNRERVGTPYGVVVMDCPIHGR